MNNVSSLVEASNMTDDYPLTNFKNKRAGSAPNLNYVHNRPPSYNHFVQPILGSWEEK
jgi:hypothetical protein